MCRSVPQGVPGKATLQACLFHVAVPASSPSPLQVPPVPLPPPYRDDWVAPGPHKPPLTREAWEFFTLLASTFNSGLEEVGGPRWREVLGQRQQQEQRRLLAAAGG